MATPTSKKYPAFKKNVEKMVERETGMKPPKRTSSTGYMPAPRKIGLDGFKERQANKEANKKSRNAI